MRQPTVDINTNARLMYRIDCHGAQRHKGRRPIRGDKTDNNMSGLRQSNWLWPCPVQSPAVFF